MYFNIVIKIIGVEASTVMQWIVNPPRLRTPGSIPGYSTILEDRGSGSQVVWKTIPSMQMDDSSILFSSAKLVPIE